VNGYSNATLSVTDHGILTTQGLAVGRRTATATIDGGTLRADGDFASNLNLTIGGSGATLDAGHVCQNLYLACEAIGAATCAMGAYHQQLMDRLVGVGGQEEFVIYLAPVGKIQVG